MKLKPAPPTQTNRALPAAFSSAWLLAVVLGLVTLAVYWPATGNGFVNYDDGIYVRDNVHVQNGLTLANFKWAFTHTVGGNWHPLTMMSHMLDCQLYGLNPWGHHFTGLLFHAANTVFLFALLRRLTGAVWLGAWVAAMFALHPAHVESVAWISERKDVLSTFFGFLCLIFYVRYVSAQKPVTVGPTDRAGRPFFFSTAYWLAFLCLALGLMSKPMLVTWPFVLLLLDYWPLGRTQPGRLRSLILEKIPFFGLTLAAAVITLAVQKMEGAVASLGGLTLAMRCENALISYCRYLMKLFWPADLAAIYPLSPRWPFTWVLLAALVLAGLSGMIWLIRRRHPFSLTGWFWFLGTLVPVIGLVQVGMQSIADRYTYIPSVGILILAAWGAHALTCRWRHQALILSMTGGVILLLCSGATWLQIGYWKNSETLARHALEATHDNYVAHNNLALAYYFERGRTNDAISELQQAIRINPDYADAHMNLGKMLGDLGQTAPALTELREAIRLDPAFPQTHYYLGTLLIKGGEVEAGMDELKKIISLNPSTPDSCHLLVNMLLASGQTNAAINELQLALKIMPSDSELHYQLGNLLLNTGQMEDAITQLEETVRLKPDLSEAHNNLGSLFLKTGQVDRAIAELKESTRLKPDNSTTHYNLGSVYLKKGLLDDAAGEFNTAIRLTPDFAPAHYYLGIILIKQGKMDAAASEFQEAIRLKPDDAFAHNKLGFVLGTQGHIHEALAEFQAAVRLKPDYAEANTNLAMALKLLGPAGH